MSDARKTAGRGREGDPASQLAPCALESIVRTQITEDLPTNHSPVHLASSSWLLLGYTVAGDIEYG